MSRRTWLLLAPTTFMLLVVGTGSCLKANTFDRGCVDYLKLAGDSPTVEKARDRLSTAIGYIERNHMTDGNVAYVFHNPSSDLGLWYGNIRGARDEADALLAQKTARPGSISRVDESNALIKIREVVIDEGKEASVTAPDNAWAYPHQWLVLFAWTVVVVMLIGSGVSLMVDTIE